MQLALDITGKQVLQGKVSNVRFRNPDNGYTVAEIKTPQGFKTIVGSMPLIGTNVQVTVQGEWTIHPRFGRQFSVQQCEVERPASEEGMIAYLQSDIIPGIGPLLAREIVEAYGEETLDILDKDPMRILEIDGIGEKTAQKIADAWNEHRHVRELVMLLGAHGVTTNMALRIYAEYGSMASEVVTQDPYRLVWDMDRVGFKTADAIALKLGFERDDSDRISAALNYVLKDYSGSGHCCMTRESLYHEAFCLLGVEQHKIEAALDATIKKGRLVEEYGAVYSHHLRQAERIVAERIVDLVNHTSDRVRVEHDDATLSKMIDKAADGIELTTKQKAGVIAAFRSRVSVLTGGPGTGKTTIIRAILGVKPDTAMAYLMAPTGRAAKRMTEATGIPAFTIHRGCGYNPELGWTLNRDTPIEADLFIIDEASMLDISVAQHLLEAIPDGAHVVFVGDVDQLPSVGPGNVLRDIIDSDGVTVTELDVIWRQAGDSSIIPASHAINNGEYPSFARDPQSGDVFLFRTDTQENAREVILDLVLHRIPNVFGIPSSEVQVLGPMYKGAAGVLEINKSLQTLLNPQTTDKSELKLGNKVWRVGDKVMQIKNNYDADVFNGDLGIVSLIDKDDEGNDRIWCEFDEQHVPYYPKDLSENLRHAWAMTIHKSQGSEFKAIVIPFMTAHYIMLQRNLLYTAVTRAQKLVVIVGQARALHIAIQNNKVESRRTNLTERIKRGLGLDRVESLPVYKEAAALLYP